MGITKLPSSAFYLLPLYYLSLITDNDIFFFLFENINTVFHTYRDAVQRNLTQWNTIQYDSTPRHRIIELSEFGLSNNYIIESFSKYQNDEKKKIQISNIV